MIISYTKALNLYLNASSNVKYEVRTIFLTLHAFLRITISTYSTLNIVFYKLNDCA